ncbi:hypothetical protein [Hallella colorans]|uniref:hypothetical protein n=1 Tax=Hallella colorans TaxID=1703337 RepID=UPI0023EFC8BA|nr:hypothetical protein [Hallella colorans]
MANKGIVMLMDKGLSEAKLPNTDYQNIKAEFDKLCDEQESLYKQEFEAVFKELHKLDTTLTKNYPCTKDEDLLNEAFRVAGVETDEAFCADFKKYNALFVEGKELQKKGLELLARNYPRKRKQVGGWNFVPITIVGTPELIQIVDEIKERDAQEGKGLFANITQIPKEDEALDDYLGVEAYGLKCSFVTFLDELKQYSIVGGDKPFFSDEMTRGLFTFLKEAATYLKEHTDKPQSIKNEIARLVKSFDSIPHWGLFLQILFLQGLCRLLEGVNINEGDNGYNEACSLYNWLSLLLGEKEVKFCFQPYEEKDLEILNPLCTYLMSTRMGQEVQKRFKPEQAAPEPQQEKAKPTRGKGRPKETLKDKMIDDANGEKLQKMHSKMNGKKGKDATLIVLACIKNGWLTRPTYTQVKNEFGDIGSKTGYNRYLNENMFTDKEIEGAINSLD